MTRKWQSSHAQIWPSKDPSFDQTSSWYPRTASSEWWARYCLNSAPSSLLCLTGFCWKWMSLRVWLVDKESQCAHHFQLGQWEVSFISLGRGSSWATAQNDVSVFCVSSFLWSVCACLLTHTFGKTGVSFVKWRWFICLLFKVLLIGLIWSWQPITCSQMFWKLSNPWNSKTENYGFRWSTWAPDSLGPNPRAHVSGIRFLRPHFLICTQKIVILTSRRIVVSSE